MIIKDLIPYSEALPLKDIGFNEECSAVFSEQGELSPLVQFPVCNSNVPSYCTAPTYRTVFKWFRDTHKLHIEIIWDHSEPVIWYYAISKIGDLEFKHISSYPDNLFNTPEEAELAGLKKLIEIIKKND